MAATPSSATNSRIAPRIVGPSMTRRLRVGIDEAAGVAHLGPDSGLGAITGRSGASSGAGRADPPGDGASVGSGGAIGATPARTGNIGSSRPPSASQQAACWPSPTSNSGGSSTRQRSNARGQRGWKRQPVGMAAAFGRLADLRM